MLAAVDAAKPDEFEVVEGFAEPCEEVGVA